MSRSWKANLFLVCLMFSSLLFVPGPQAETRGEIGGFFGSERLYNTSRALSGGMAAGNLDSDDDIEVVFCDFSGIVGILDPRPDGSFKPTPIWQQEGNPGSGNGLFDLVIGDIFPDVDGIEIAVGGYSGKLFVLYRENDLWTSEVIYTMPLDDDDEPIRIFELEIADVDPSPGEEILIGSNLNDQQSEPDRYLRYLYNDGNEWNVEVIELPETVKAIAYGDADPSVEGEELYVTTSGWNQGGSQSSLLEIYRNGSLWTVKEIFKNPTSMIMNVKVGELWSGHEGMELITAELSGWCRLLWEDSGEFQHKDVFQAKTSSGSSSPLEGMAIGDFNPINDGDEAMVTGYYNEVTQIIEVDGQVVSDRAWITEATEVKLELSGVEVYDVSDKHSGNEVLVASLQGWIEMLYFETDGLDMELPQEPLEIEMDSSGQFDIRVFPRGRVNGELTVDITGGVDVELFYDETVILDYGTPVTIPVIVNPTQGDSRTFDLDITISAAGETRSGKMAIEIVPSASEFTIIVDPSSVTMYDKAGNNFNGKVSLAGAESYDTIELSVNSVEGLTVMIDSLIEPGEEKDVVVQVSSGFIGSRKITVTGSYNSVPVAQAALFVDVISLEDALDFNLMEDDEGNYYVKAYLNGSAPVKDLTIRTLLDGEVYRTQDLDMEANSQKDLPLLPLNDGDKGEITIEVTNIAQIPVMSMSLGEVSLESEEDDSVRASAWIIGIIVILVAIGIIVVGLYFTKPKEDEPQDMSVESIGGRRKYDYRTPKRDKERRRPPPRRAPPRERRGPPSGPRF